MIEVLHVRFGIGCGTGRLLRCIQSFDAQLFKALLGPFLQSGIMERMEQPDFMLEVSVLCAMLFLEFRDAQTMLMVDLLLYFLFHCFAVVYSAPLRHAPRPRSHLCLSSEETEFGIVDDFIDRSRRILL